MASVFGGGGGGEDVAFIGGLFADGKQLELGQRELP
jgi:hypothetical protein